MNVAWQLPTDLPTDPLFYVAWRLARLALKGLGCQATGQPQAPLRFLPTDFTKRQLIRAEDRSPKSALRGGLAACPGAQGCGVLASDLVRVS